MTLMFSDSVLGRRRQFLKCVNRRLDRTRTLPDTAGSFHFVSGPVNDHKELVCFKRSLIFEHAVFGDADAVQCRTNRTDATDNNGPLQGADDPRHDRTTYDDRADSGKGRPEEQAPQAAPEGAQLAQYIIRSPVL
jgi:hypothetical protein